jgi:hypothetical protein
VQCPEALRALPGKEKEMQFVAVLSAIGVGYFIAFGLLMLHV